MAFSIKSIDRNQITLKSGSKSYLFEVTPLDLEQLTDSELDSFYEDILAWLNGLPSGRYYRVMYIDGRVLVNTDSRELDLHRCSVTPLDVEIEFFYGLDDLYSNPTLCGDTVLVNGIYWKFINIYNMPLTPLRCELMRNGDYIINLKKIATEKAKRTLSFRRKMHYSSLYKNIKDIEGEKSYFENESLLDEIIQGTDSLFDFEGWHVVRAETLEEINEKTKEILATMNRLNYAGLIETDGALRFYKNNLFFMPPSFKRKHPANAKYLRDLLPLRRDFVHESGIEFESRSGNAIFLNFNHPGMNNNNIVVSGASGGGKSFLVNKIINEEVKEGASGIIIDYDESYCRTTKYNNGVILPNSFNPMMFKSNAVFLKSIIMCFVDNADFDKKEQGRLFEEIKKCVELDSELTFRGLIEKLNLSFKGISYYFSEYWDFFSNEFIDFSCITYIDCNQYPKKILPPLIMYLIEVFKSLEGTRFLVAEESWYLLKHASEFIENFFRTYRKKGAKAIAVVQNLEDFINNETGRVILQNSSHDLRFGQSLKENEFTDKHDLEQNKTLKGIKKQFSEFYYKSDLDRKCVRYYSTEIEYELFNTTRGDSENLVRFIEEYSKFFTYKECVDKFARLKNA